jgi:hypothetical protein
VSLRFRQEEEEEEGKKKEFAWLADLKLLRLVKKALFGFVI